jgi:solute carrier family 25 folate transporter 32
MASSAATTAAAASPPNPAKSPKKLNGKLSLFSHIKYEHMVAGISGGVTSTLILHPLDLIKIRFAGEFNRHKTLNKKGRGLSN